MNSQILAGTRDHLTRASLLLVEDDAETRRVVGDALEAEGYRVRRVGTVAAAEPAASQAAAVVLDVGLPDGDATALCERWRRAGLLVPVLMLTARTDVAARVKGLDSGADDYLGKPFALSELRARVRALLRRTPAAAPQRVWEWGAVRVDFGARRAWVARDEVPLTRREFDLVERLIWARGLVVPREELLESVWGDVTPEASASLDVILARLRRKLNAGDGRESAIRTVRGVGYAIDGGDLR